VKVASWRPVPCTSSMGRGMVAYQLGGSIFKMVRLSPLGEGAPGVCALAAQERTRLVVAMARSGAHSKNRRPQIEENMMSLRRWRG
jgi:hypothetical protein